jgi:hypothetical protein
MIKRFGLIDDRALQQIAQIVHDIDLKDNKFNRLEASGLSAIVSGLADLLKDNRKLAAQSLSIFDGLYQLFGEGENRAKEKSSGKRISGSHSRKRPPRRK